MTYEVRGPDPDGDWFAGWIADRIRQYDFIEDIDFVTYSVNSEKGPPAKEYAIDETSATEAAAQAAVDRLNR